MRRIFEIDLPKNKASYEISDLSLYSVVSLFHYTAITGTPVQPMTKPSRYVQSQIRTKGRRKRKGRVIFLRFSGFSIPKPKAKGMLKERDEAEWFRIE